MSKSKLKRVAIQQDKLRDLANFISESLRLAAEGPSKGYSRRIVNIQVEDECDAGAIIIGEGWELDAEEGKLLISAIDAARKASEPKI